MSSTDELHPVMHLKPWTEMYTARCGCGVSRSQDGGVSVVQCAPHYRAFLAVTGELDRGRRMSQREMLRAAGLGKSN